MTSPAKRRTRSRLPGWLRPTLTLIFIVGLISGANLFVSGQQRQLETQHYSNAIRNLEIAVQQAINGYERSAQIIYDERLNQPDVLALYREIAGGSPDKQALIRGTLYDMLLPEYERLQALNLSQMQFHLPDDTSFLRFSSPEDFGDDLTGLRTTVTLANTTLQPASGFEIGRTLNGFRYVFPLIDTGGQHLGSVELSASFLAIQQDLNRLLPGGTAFMLRRDEAISSAFAEEQGDYTETDWASDYVYEQAVIDSFDNRQMTWETLQALNRELNAGPLAQSQAFAQAISLGDTNYLAVFLPIVNVDGNHVGWIMSYAEDDFIAGTRSAGTFTRTTVGTIGLLLIAFSLYLERTNALIQRQRDELAVQNEQLAHARAEAEAASELKSQFLANMSHELRTPLNAILNFTRFVSSGMLGPISPKQIETLDKVGENGKHLLSLINDVLDISKIESGGLKLFIEEEVPLEVEFRAAADVARSAIEGKPVRLVEELEEDLPGIVCDRRRVRQIMLNLVSNACKFTDAGEVRLRLQQEGDDLVFCVHDNGPGIDPSEADLIFETFRQTNAGLRKGSGTGLGLPISRRLAEAMGGSLWFESEPGAGASFYVRLPIRSGALLEQRRTDQAQATRPGTTTLRAAESFPEAGS